MSARATASATPLASDTANLYSFYVVTLALPEARHLLRLKPEPVQTSSYAGNPATLRRIFGRTMIILPTAPAAAARTSRSTAIAGFLALFVAITAGCARHAMQSSPTAGPINTTHLHSEEMRLLNRPQQSNPIHTPPGRGWWYFEHPKERASVISACNNQQAKLGSTSAADRKLLACSDAIDGQTYAYEQNPQVLKQLLERCAKRKNLYELFSECRAANLAEQRRNSR